MNTLFFSYIGSLWSLDFARRMVKSGLTALVCSQVTESCCILYRKRSVHKWHHKFSQHFWNLNFRKIWSIFSKTFFQNVELRKYLFRNPKLDKCFSVEKQYFNRGQSFSPLKLLQLLAAAVKLTSTQSRAVGNSWGWGRGENKLNLSSILSNIWTLSRVSLRQWKLWKYDKNGFKLHISAVLALYCQFGLSYWSYNRMARLRSENLLLYLYDYDKEL